MDFRRGTAQRAIAEGRCPWCGYNVKGLRATICPECGRDWSKWVTPPDPGSPWMARWAGLLAFLLIIGVAVIQQTSESAAVRAAGQAPGTPVAPVVKPPSTQFEIVGKFLSKVAIWQRDPQGGARTVETLETQAKTPEDKLRVAIVAGDLLGEAEGRKRLGAVEEQLADDSPLAEDIRTVRAIYEGNADPAKVTELEKRHGWFGRLASTYGLPMADEDRREVAGGGGKIIGLGATVGIGGLVILAVAFTLFIIGLVLWINGSLWPRFVPPAPGGSVAIETVAVFAAAFIGLKFATEGVESLTHSATAAVVFALTAQWALVSVLFWPVARGVPAGETLALWGLHRGEGVLKEIACGIVGYIGLLPLLVGGVVVSLILMFMYETARRLVGLPEPAAPENPILDLLGGKTPAWLLVLLGALASLWAPLVEESVFRGALFRQLRTKWHWLPAGLVTALGFGLMHGYPIPLLGPVIALGFGFSFLREWRGSLIASMTAHCLHNTVVLTVLLVALKYVGI